MDEYRTIKKRGIEMDKILILGASGYIGGKLMKQLGHDYECFGTYHQHALECNEDKMFYLDLKSYEALEGHLKEINPKQHIVVTRQPNTNILAFARYLSDKGVPVWIRHVLVPGLTDFDEDLIELGKFVETLKNVDKFEILPYHTLGEFKWRELGIPYTLEGVKPPTRERVQNAKKLMHTESYTDYMKRIHH